MTRYMQPAFISATAVIDFPSIAANNAADATITVPGSVVGDAVTLGPPASLDAGVGVIWWAVTAANTVTVRLRNFTGVAVDPASATWRATIVR